MLAASSHFARIRAIAVTLYQPLNLLMPHVQPKRPGCQNKKGGKRAIRNNNDLIRHILHGFALYQQVAHSYPFTESEQARTRSYPNSKDHESEMP